MTGRTYLIIQDLKAKLSVGEIALKHGVTKSYVYKVAKRYKIKLPPVTKLDAEEKKKRKRIANTRAYQKRKKFNLQRPDIPDPQLPFVSVKRTGLSALNSAWVFRESFKLSSEKEHRQTQEKYGLK